MQKSSQAKLERSKQRKAKLKRMGCFPVLSSRFSRTSMPNSIVPRPHLQMPKYKEIKAALKGRVLSRNTRSRKLRKRSERKKALARAKADNTEYHPEMHEDHSHDSTLCEFEHFWKIYVDIGLGIFDVFFVMKTIVHIFELFLVMVVTIWSMFQYDYDYY